MALEVAWVPACAGMTEGGAGVAGEGMAKGDGGGGVEDLERDTTAGSDSLPSTPHLTSPLEGGRDELGKGGGGAWCVGARGFLPAQE